MRENKIIEKYRNLNQACKKYPRIKLTNNRSGSAIPIVLASEEINHIAENGFIETFCLDEEQRKQLINIVQREKIIVNLIR